jgi:energy-coupling factor transporter transmembrane protein EcfT
VAGGALFFGTFILALIGLLIVIACRRNDPWWRFILFGLLISIVPGAIATDAFHALRLMAYPVFLLVLMVPALEWFLARDKDKVVPVPEIPPGAELPALETNERLQTGVVEAVWPRFLRRWVLSGILALIAVEAIRFQTIFQREGPHREFDFDFHYKAAYDLATAQPIRPIYLEDGYWGPAYIHALWYAALEKRPKSEFVHLSFRNPPPSGAMVISSEKDDLLKAACPNCVIIKQSGLFTVYKKP